MSNFYVYVYLDQRKPGLWEFEGWRFEFQPFYVGKGVGKRESVHLCPFMKQQKNFKNSTIKAIEKETGEHPLHLRIREGLTNEESQELEKRFIKHFGRSDNGTGILCNLTDGGDGANGFTEETKNKMRGPRSNKKIFQYSLDGKFVKEWAGIFEINNAGFQSANIVTSIRRKGTCDGFFWSYEFLGENIPKKLKHQAPTRYTNIKQICSISGEIVNVFSSVREAEESLGLRKGARNKILDCIFKRGGIKTIYGFRWER